MQQLLGYLLFASILLTASCGQKGPLILEEKTTAEKPSTETLKEKKAQSENDK